MAVLARPPPALWYLLQWGCVVDRAGDHIGDPVTGPGPSPTSRVLQRPLRAAIERGSPMRGPALGGKEVMW
ncbi:hypothetical protein NDU88_007037 [Pleurodeles waltl]|uniref:Secreted protein n=1 Tax=Pleurodeles waltl TaxID=8319 RepID=A0AAV7N167_PLEWA|nr:hypothetical protein NDU88_007037 [Pleurodeles waltl]